MATSVPAPKPVVMRCLILPEEIYQYLLGHVFEKHVQTGIPSDELAIASATSACLRKAQEVDFGKLGKAEIEKLGPGGVALNLVPGTDPVIPNNGGEDSDFANPDGGPAPPGCERMERSSS